IGNDLAVLITVNQGTLTAYDYSTIPNPVQLSFSDMVGQPTWIGNDIMQVKVVMRADINVGRLIEMPKGLQGTPGIVLTSEASSPSFYKYKSLFQGKFYVQSMRHIGNFRSSDGASWVTVMNCVPLGNPNG
ncbi:MAG: hypothetical protein KGI54_18760, partial [Pseudomonadota bacterium]|nr:hypothetical protein [Pseudomonadota bacterium]